MSRRLILAGIVAVVLILGVLQVASDAVFARAGTSVSIPGSLSCEQGIRMYAALPFLPIAYTAGPVVTCALQSGDLQLADSALARMPRSPERSQLAGRVARRRGLLNEAALDFVEAGDAPEAENRVDQLVRSKNIAAAFDLERALRVRMMSGAKHPNAVADIDWKLNVLATKLSRVRVRTQSDWLHQALNYDREAIELSPYAERYYIAEGNRYLDLRDARLADSAFHQALQLDPASADGFAGLGLAALARADVASARTYQRRARLANPRSGMLILLTRQLRRVP